MGIHGYVYSMALNVLEVNLGTYISRILSLETDKSRDI